MFLFVEVDDLDQLSHLVPIAAEMGWTNGWNCLVKSYFAHEEVLLSDIDIAKIYRGSRHLFERLGYIPRLDDLEHGRDVLHV